MPDPEEIIFSIKDINEVAATEPTHIIKELGADDVETFNHQLRLCRPKEERESFRGVSGEDRRKWCLEGIEDYHELFVDGEPVARCSVNATATPRGRRRT